MTIGENVKEIGYYAFKYCNRLDTIYCMRERPANANEKAFDGVNVEKCKLFVPAGSENMYMVAIAWRDFDNIIAFDPSLDVKNPFVDMRNSSKFIQNGQVLIQNGGTTYTLTGNQIK